MNVTIVDSMTVAAGVVVVAVEVEVVEVHALENEQILQN